jgi:hypothetical protein
MPDAAPHHCCSSLPCMPRLGHWERPRPSSPSSTRPRTASLSSPSFSGRSRVTSHRSRLGRRQPSFAPPWSLASEPPHPQLSTKSPSLARAAPSEPFPRSEPLSELVTAMAVPIAPSRHRRRSTSGLPPPEPAVPSCSPYHAAPLELLASPFSPRSGSSSERRLASRRLPWLHHHGPLWAEPRAPARVRRSPSARAALSRRRR